MPALDQNSIKNALDILKEDHTRIKELFQKYKNIKADDEKERISFEIQECLRIHARLEEEVFYPAMRVSAVAEEEVLLDESLKDHKAVANILDELEIMAISDETYEEKMNHLERIVEQHVEKEEEEMFPDAEDKLGDELNSLGAEMTKLKHELEL